MTKIRAMLARPPSVEEPERRGDERSEAPRSGGSSTLEPVVVPVPPDPEVPARHARRRFTTAYKLEILRKADACTRHGELGALLRKEGLDLLLREVVAGALCNVNDDQLKQLLGQRAKSVTFIKARLGFKKFEVVMQQRGFRNTRRLAVEPTTSAR